jgi:hypothetical protein
MTPDELKRAYEDATGIDERIAVLKVAVEELVSEAESRAIEEEEVGAECTLADVLPILLFSKRERRA